jgi:hypothetical protein
LTAPRGAFPFLAALSSLLPDLAAAWPARTYYFRDFSLAFYPLRELAARELGSGRVAFWNPYIYEGSFLLPVLYPLDLLHALFPGPAAVSWLLTLHLPLAALCAYALARELGADAPGAFAAGAVYSLGGLAPSSLNLYVFLQALALAPLVALLLRRAAVRGGRSLVLAALVVALACSTLAVEFVGQAVLLGALLGLAASFRPGAGLRIALVLALGFGLAAVPVAVTLGLLPETVRGAGFQGDVALGNAVHPVALVQSVLPHLFGSLADPVGAWWGGRFFSKGFPYFLSLYLGPLALALAAAGVGGLERRARAVLLGLGALALLYALGGYGGLAPLVSRLPMMAAVRFPSKALLLPHLAVAVLAGFGFDRLRRGEGWRPFAWALSAVGACVLGVALAVRSSEWLSRWGGIEAARVAGVRGVLHADCLWALGLAMIGLLLAGAVAASRASPARAAWVVAALLVLDLRRAADGMNPQTHPSFFAPLPEIAALRLSDLDGGRVFSYGADASPAFRAFLAQGGPGLGLRSFFVNRQLLAPYTNMLDRVEAPEATDLTSFVPRARELGLEDYDPARVAGLLPWWRNAAVSRVLSLDPLEHRALEPLASIPVGAGTAIHAYRVRDTGPRAFVACRAVVVSAADAIHEPYAPGFDVGRDVALEEPAAADCTTGRASREASVPGDERYVAELDGRGLLVVRDSFARGWKAWVDGRPVAVLRADGKHRAVPLGPGHHELRLRYEPPGLRAGLAAAVGSALLLGIVWARARPRS